MWSNATASHDTAIPSAHAWKLVGVIWLAFVLNYIDRQAAFSIFPVLRSELGFSETQLGLVGSVFIWTYSLVNPLAGRLADLLRREDLMTASMVLWSVAALGSATSRSPVQFLLWRAGMGITEALFVPAALSRIASAHPGATRSRALALYSTGQMVGIVIGGWFGGWMVPALGWRGGFVVLAGVGIAFAPVFWRLLGRSERDSVATPSSQRPGIVLGSRCYLALAVAFLLLCALLWMVYGWLPEFLYSRYGLTLAAAGLVATAYTQTGSVGGLLLGGWIADRLTVHLRPARFYVAAAGLALASPFAALIFAGPDLSFLKLYTGCFGLCSSLMIANVFAAAYDVIPKSSYGFGGGALNMVGGLSGGVAMFAAGYWTNLGPRGLTRGAAVAGLVTALLLFAVAHRRFLSDRHRAGLAD
jgi:MFS family permease